MKAKSLFILFLLIGVLGHAQTQQGKITYQMIFPDNPEFRIYTMWFTQQDYIYGFSNMKQEETGPAAAAKYKDAADSIRHREVENKFKTVAARRKQYWYGEIGSNVVVYSSFDNTDKKYCIRDTLSFVDWQILPDTMTVDNILCQKASGKYKEMDYTAWFAPSIPVSSCFMQFRGLPGLLIKTVNNTTKVTIEMMDLEWPAKTPVAIAPCSDAPFISKQEMADMIYKQNARQQARLDDLRKKNRVREQ
jgi:GLPGLI family protein